jgi:hypothetical protein
MQMDTLVAYPTAVQSSFMAHVVL